MFKVVARPLLAYSINNAIGFINETFSQLVLNKKINLKINLNNTRRSLVVT